MMMTRLTASEYAAGLRAIAEFYEANPDLPTPQAEITVYNINGKEQMAHFARALVRAHKEVDKKADPTFFVISASFSGVVLRACDWRNNVCERVAVGTKIVEEQLIPARPAEPERLIPAHEEEITEWRCPSLLELTKEPEI
ncbi:MAG TPA: hypothetical protein VLH56_19070 [Dissulfurispiraceae bacterium]|nr:hypothetical protein [Dissulfurispiraceae bacterium]